MSAATKFELQEKENPFPTSKCLKRKIPAIVDEDTTQETYTGFELVESTQKKVLSDLRKLLLFPCSPWLVIVMYNVASSRHAETK